MHGIVFWATHRPTEGVGVSVGVKRKRQAFKEEMLDMQIQRWMRLRGVDIHRELEEMSGMKTWKGIWESFIERAMTNGGKGIYRPGKLDKLAEYNFNGREVDQKRSRSSLLFALMDRQEELSDLVKRSPSESACDARGHAKAHSSWSCSITSSCTISFVSLKAATSIALDFRNATEPLISTSYNNIF
jgi:hypothetical protein